jgi:hypothetical protein
MEDKSLDWARDVLQPERTKPLKREVEPVLHMIPHRARDTDASGWTFSLKPRSDIHHIAMQISPVCNGIADIDANTKSDGAIGGMITIVVWHFSLNLRGTPHRPIDAVEHYKQRIAPSVDDPAAMFSDGWVNQRSAECSEPFEGSDIIQTNEAAVANHVGMDDGNELSRT